MSAAVYMDHNATTPPRAGVAEAMRAALELAGNASSIHGRGRKARAVIEDAREAVAALVGADPLRVVFTSGGTEANHLALGGAGFSRVLVGASEHASVLNAALPADIERETVPVGRDGVIDLCALEEMLAAGVEPALVSVMLANNETGVLNPIDRVVDIACRFGALVHCDAVQAAGKLPVDMTALGVHLLSLSAHKLGGPQGVGALVVDDAVPLIAMFGGGGQERGHRAGTENLPGIAGFGAAALAAAADVHAFAARTGALRDRLEAKVRAIAPEAVIVGAQAPRLCNTSCIATPDLAAETQVMTLDLAGVMVGAGAACSSGRLGRSHVVEAMGLGPEIARTAIRVSLGSDSREEDIDRFIDAWRAVRVRARSNQGVAAPAA